MVITRRFIGMVPSLFSFADSIVLHVLTIDNNTRHCSTIKRGCQIYLPFCGIKRRVLCKMTLEAVENARAVYKMNRNKKVLKKLLTKRENGDIITKP